MVDTVSDNNPNTTAAQLDLGEVGKASADKGPFEVGDGFDLAARQIKLRDQTKAVEDKIRQIEENTNLSDTEKMFAMQMALNSWSAISSLRTNMIKAVADALKAIVRNVA